MWITFYIFFLNTLSYLRCQRFEMLLFLSVCFGDEDAPDSHTSDPDALQNSQWTLRDKQMSSLRTQHHLSSELSTDRILILWWCKYYTVTSTLCFLICRLWFLPTVQNILIRNEWNKAKCYIICLCFLFIVNGLNMAGSNVSINETIHTKITFQCTDFQCLHTKEQHNLQIKKMYK